MLELYVDNSNIFSKIVQGWSLKGTRSIHKNYTAKIRIVFHEDKSIYLPHSLNKVLLDI